MRLKEVGILVTTWVSKRMSRAEAGVSTLLVVYKLNRAAVDTVLAAVGRCRDSPEVGGGGVQAKARGGLR
jgi:hypothetical protein